MIDINLIHRYFKENRLGNIVTSAGEHWVKSDSLFKPYKCNIGSKVCLQKLFTAIDMYLAETDKKLVALIGYGSAFQDPEEIKTFHTRKFFDALNFFIKKKRYKPIHDVDFMLLVNELNSVEIETIYDSLPSFGFRHDYDYCLDVMASSGIHLVVSTVEQLKKGPMYNEIIRDGVILSGSFPEKTNGKKCVWSTANYLEAKVV